MSEIKTTTTRFVRSRATRLRSSWHAGIEPTVIDYMRTPPSRAKLLELRAAMQAPVRSLVRVHSLQGAELGLWDPEWSDDALLDLVLERPVFLNRPIVITPLGTKLCRPSETLLELLTDPRLSPSSRKTAASWWIAASVGW